MNILLLTQKLPAPISDGYNLRIHHYVPRLARKHTVHLASLDEGEIADDWAGCLAGLHRLGVREQPRPRSLLHRAVQAFDADHYHDFDPAVMAAIRALVDAERFDLVWVSGWKMLVYSHRLAGPPVFGDVIDEGAQDAWSALKRARGPLELARRFKRFVATRAFERKYFRHLARCNVVSEQDAEALRSTSPWLDVSVVHNGVDADFFAPREPEGDEPSLVFEANYSHPVNREGILHFHEHVFPRVLAEVPEAKLWIVGREPPSEVRALAGPQVVVTGYVDDVRPWLDRAWVFVSPLVGGAGIKNKVLQAWSMGLPVVATPISTGGLDAEEGENILVADSPADFADACVRLLRDEQLRSIMGSFARATVLGGYTWDAKGLELEQAMIGCLEPEADGGSGPSPGGTPEPERERVGR